MSYCMSQLIRYGSNCGICPKYKVKCMWYRRGKCRNKDRVEVKDERH